MNPTEILLTVCEILNNLNIKYMLVGADAVNFYGRPRTTHDIDIKIAILPTDIDNIYTSFLNDYYIDRTMIQDAVKYKSMFNIIHNESGLKIDFWILKDGEYEIQRFLRRIKVLIFDKPVYISTAEDLIITKLDWYKESTSEKHYLDALGIYEVQYGKLDEKYIEDWVKIQSTYNLWQKIKNEVII